MEEHEFQKKEKNKLYLTKILFVIILTREKWSEIIFIQRRETCSAAAAIRKESGQRANKGP